MLFLPRKKTVIFGGPSLTLVKSKALNYFEFRPPIKRGDLISILDAGGKKPIVLITDGVFGSSLAITPNECIEYIDKGGLLFGSSSIGALRAADCFTRGMVGIGDIFMAYHLGYYHSESDVAVVYDQNSFEEITYSYAHIDNILKILLREKLITSIIFRKIGKQIKKIVWYERHDKNIMQAIASETDCGIITDKFKSLLNNDTYHPKKKDALLACSYLLQYHNKQSEII